MVTGPEPATAVEGGPPAPDFKLPSTLGGDFSLGDFRGTQWVLLEFRRRRLRADLSGDSERRGQRHHQLLATDLCRIPEAAVPAHQRFPRPDGQAATSRW